MSIKIRSVRPAPHDHSEADQLPVVTSGVASGAVIETSIGADAILADHIASGQVGTSELAAVAVTEAIIASGAVVSGKIGAAAVTTPAIAPLAVTLEKTSEPVRTALYLGDETEVSHDTDTMTMKKNWAMGVAPLALDHFVVQCRMRTTTSGQTGLITFFHDFISGAPVDLEFSTVSSGYEVKSGMISVGAWGAGHHTMEMFATATSGYSVYQELFELFSVQS